MAKAPTNKYTLRNVQELVEILTVAATKSFVDQQGDSGIKKGAQIVERASNVIFNHRPKVKLRKIRTLSFG
jgi:hypothetical protein